MHRLALCAIVLFAATAHAAPPPGWIVPAAKGVVVLPKPAPQSRAALMRNQSRPDRTVRVVGTRDVSKLPVVEIEPRPILDAWGARPRVFPKSLSAPELRIIDDRSSPYVILTLHDPWLAFIQHRFPVPDEKRPGIVGGTSPACRAEARVDPLEWEGVKLRSDGALDVVSGVAWWNGPACAPVVLWRMQAVAKPLYGPNVYAFRTHCSKCKPGERDKLQIVHSTLALALRAQLDPAITDNPGPIDWELTLKSLPLDAGTSGRSVAWLADTYRPGIGRDRLTLEVQRGNHERRASLLLYVSEP